MIIRNKKLFLLIIFLLQLLLLAGCETAKGIAKGLPKDVKNTWTALSEADEWIRKNLW